MTPPSIVEAYFKELTSKFRTGQAGEHAYRPALQTLIKGIDQTINPLNDPKRSEFGAPDFIFMRGDITAGYAETKDIGEDLNKVEKTEQMKRYFGYSNLILTDYLEFRFFRNGERYGEPIMIAEIVGNELTARPNSFPILIDALSDFLRGQPEPIRSGAQLSKIMGGKARRIRDNVRRYLQVENDKNAELVRIYDSIKRLLVHDLSTDAFSDMYAQTLVYGLFVARYNDETPEAFTRQEARDLIPASNPFLREFFDHIVGPKFDTRLRHIVDELCAAFSVSDVREIVHRHLKVDGAKHDEKDPIIHFYEDFLKEYDPVVRKAMGAYYTPIPVARFIVRAVDEALKRDFGLSKGLADTTKRKVDVVSQGKKAKIDLHRVQILDPAVGTATFLNEVISYVHQSFAGQEGRWPAYVEADLLPRLSGFELMMAPYTIAHLKLGMTLRETGCGKLNQRLGVYLTNTLEEGTLVSDTLWANLGLSQVIAEEAAEAGKIKKERPIMVVIGNPPYSGVSSNETEYANQLIAKYKVEPGGKMKLQERKHWLNDDYVKFIAFAEDMIEKNGEGIVAMITNHGYLDNPTFRGMRWHLAKTFDSIHVLDLHGNAKKKETAPDGGKDENVFDIQQGVAIMIAVKTGRKKSGEMAQVYHADLFGKRKEKFERLEASEPDWQEITLDNELFFFAKKDLTGADEYKKYIAVNALFPVNVTGIVTARDSVVIDTSKKALLNRISRFADPNYSDEETRSWLFPGKKDRKYPAGDSRGWKLPEARKAVADEDHEKMIRTISYRPFDTQYIYYSPKMVDWGRFDVMTNFLKGRNIGLIVARQAITDNWSHVEVVDSMTDNRFHYSNKGIPVEMPLYLYHNNGSRTANFDRDTLKSLTKNLHKPYEPEDVLDYIYAVLHSPKYRETYKEFLKTDFPRVPAPTDDVQFHRLAAFGKQLRELHLMTTPLVSDFITTYPKDGSNAVEVVTYKEGNVWINKEQYFGNVPVIAWNFYIGGYQPAQKWLKDRKGTTLTNEDIEHYQKMIVALTETGRIMKEIDE